MRRACILVARVTGWTRQELMDLPLSELFADLAAVTAVEREIAKAAARK